VSRRTAAFLDVAGVIAFVVIGRASHGHSETAQGIFSTWWPFASGTVIGWAIVWTRRPASVPSGVIVCASTVAVGMALRIAAGQGTAPAFIGVTTGFLGAVMVGGRVACGLWSRRPWRPAAGAHPTRVS